MSSIGSRRRRATYKFLLATLPVVIASANQTAEAAPDDKDEAKLAAAFAMADATRRENTYHCVHGSCDWLDRMGDELFPGSGFAQGGAGPGRGSAGTYSGQLGMYVSSGSPDMPGWGGSVGYSAIRGSGIRAADTAGAIAPGETVSVRDTSGSGGILGTFDATRFFGLSGNQSAFFTAYFDYQGDSASLGAVPGVGAAFIQTGSLRTDTYTFGGSLFYRSGTTYLDGEAAYNFGRNNETNFLGGGATGSFNSNGYSVDAKLGKVFVLSNTTGVSTSAAMPTKAPPKPTGGTLVGLDLSGHLGYFEDRLDGFTDSTGFTFGTGQTRSGDIGGRAELFALMPGNGLVWKPYVAGTVDQFFGLSTTVNIPSQVALAGGDLLSVQAARTFGGAELGVAARGSGGWTVDVKGFYEASTDTTITGGSVTLKIPFNYTATVASRY